MVQEIRALYAYNRWANARLLDAASQLDPEQFTRNLGSSFASVRETLVHILGAEWIWLERWRGRSPSDFPAWDLSTCDAIRSQWKQVERAQEVFLAELSPERMERVIAYRTTAGEPNQAPLGQMLRHVVNHSTYHRGQVATLLRQLGRRAPATDLILFHREQASAPDPVARA